MRNLVHAYPRFTLVVGWERVCQNSIPIILSRGRWGLVHFFFSWYVVFFVCSRPGETSGSRILLTFRLGIPQHVTSV